MRNALVIDGKDNVVVAIEVVQAGSEVSYQLDGETVTFNARQDIPIYHKMATKDIAKGETVYKYGEPIAVALQDIRQGAHVHVHNIDSPKLVNK